MLTFLVFQRQLWQQNKVMENVGFIAAPSFLFLLTMLGLELSLFARWLDLWMLNNGNPQLPFKPQLFSLRLNKTDLKAELRKLSVQALRRGEQHGILGISCLPLVTPSGAAPAPPWRMALRSGGCQERLHMTIWAPLHQAIQAVFPSISNHWTSVHNWKIVIRGPQ